MNANAPLELLGIDFGLQKTGLARMQSAVGIPEPIETVFETDQQRLIDTVLFISEGNGTDIIVVGLPLNVDGSESEQTALTRQFVQALRKRTALPVHFCDERFSSVESDKWQLRYPQSSEDSRAACRILERYVQEGAA